MSAETLIQTIQVITQHVYDDIETSDLPDYFEEYGADYYNAIYKMKNIAARIYKETIDKGLKDKAYPIALKLLNTYGISEESCEMIINIIFKSLEEVNKQLKSYLITGITKVYLEDFDEKQVKEISSYLSNVLHKFYEAIETNKENLIQSCLK